MDIREWLGEDNQIGYDIWTKKYQHENESFEEWLDRISGGDEELRELIKQKKFLFGGRILSNRGLDLEQKVTYSNCYVIAPPQDNLESIYSTASKLARTYSYGGGCGIDISHLSPAGARVRNQAYKTTGAVSFMPTFNEVTKTIGQNGRRGALMISIDCTHPDLPEFIDIKAKDDSIEHANISIRVSDDFMNAVIHDKDWKMEFIRPETGERIVRYEKAKDLFDKIATNNWNWAEPGFLYWDRISSYNLLEYEPNFEYAGLNPCAEEPLPAGGSCLLGSLNLSAYVKKPFTEQAYLDIDELIRDIYVYVRALNEVLDEGLMKHPLREQQKAVKDWRQIGLGIMGLADALIKLNLTYGSDEAIKFVDKTGRVIATTAITASSELARSKGTYRQFSNRVYDSHFYESHVTNVFPELDRQVRKNGLCNSQLLTCAPTGSIATMLGISTGIEPLFARSWKRKTESLHGEDKYYIQYPTIVQEAMEKTGKSVEDLDDIIVTAHDIKPIQRIKMQSVLQKHIDASISSTINLPYEATVDDIKQIYLEGWKNGLKGVTVYREGSAKGGILTSQDSDSKEHTEHIEQENSSSLPKRGEVMDIQDDKVIGLKKKLVSGCGSLHCAAYFDVETGDLREIYLSKGSTGGCVDADTEYFNGTEWKPISQYIIGSEEKVLQYNLNGTAELVLPNAYIENENVDSLYHFYNSYGMDMVLSEEHRMFAYKNYRKYQAGIRPNLTYEIMTVNEYIEREGSKERHVPTTFNYAGCGLPLSNELIRLLVAIYADGTWDGHKIVVSLKKERKKERLEKLLEEANIGYSRRDIRNTEYTKYCLYPSPKEKQWFVDKQFTNKWLECTDEQAKVVIDECVYWDGSIPAGNRLGEYYSSKKEEIDILQFLLARLGYRGTISDNTSSVSIKPSYRLRWTKRNVHNLKYATIEKYPTRDGKSYCFNVPSGLLVLRRNNKIFVTGNCANFMTGLSRMISMSARAGVKIHDIVDQLMSTGVCPSYATRSKTKHDTSKGSCCPMAVGYALQEMWEEFNGIKMNATKTTTEREGIVQEKIKKEEAKNIPRCPDCGAPLTFEGGCNICKECGYSKCD